MLAMRYAALVRSRTHIESIAPNGSPIDKSSFSEPPSRISTSVMTTIDRPSVRMPQTEQIDEAFRALVQASAAVAGYLFILRSDGPVLDGKYGDFEPPADLKEAVATFLSAEVDSAQEVQVGEADSAALIAPYCWTGPDGGLHFPTLLTHDTLSGTMINGVVVLRSPDEHPVYAPRDLCVALSRELEDLDDIHTSLAAI
jgi:hypothetical protein